MNAHPSFKRTSAITSLSNVTGTTLATEVVACFSRIEEATPDYDVTASKVTGPAASILTDRSMLPRIPSSSQGMIEKITFLDVLPFLYAEPLSQTAEPYLYFRD